MANQATLNPTLEQLVDRHSGRIARLRESISKAESRDDQERIDSLQSELARRMEALESVRDSVESVLGR